MRKFLVFAIAFVLIFAGCGRDAEKDPSRTAAPAAAGTAAQSATMPSKPPIDLGDVDSGLTIRAELARGAASSTVSADYVETLRGSLSMATITVEEPFPETLPVSFTLLSQRPFVERPVVVRIHAYRDNDRITEESSAWIMGRDARQEPVGADGKSRPRTFTVDVMAGLEGVPETMLVHARADAWLMETGTAEDLLDPRTATSAEQVAIMSNPVRINFKRAVQ